MVLAKVGMHGQIRRGHLLHGLCHLSAAAGISGYQCRYAATENIKDRKIIFVKGDRQLQAILSETK